MATKSLLIKQIKSLSQTHSRHKKTVKALGLRGVGTEIFRTDTRAIRGMLNHVRHLISAEQVDKSPTARPVKKASAKGFKLG